MAKIDPLDFTGVSFSDAKNPKIRLEALVSPEAADKLKVLRTQRGVRPEHTEGFLGRLLEEIVEAISLGLKPGTLSEPPSVALVRKQIGALLTHGREHVSQPQVVNTLGMSAPTVRLAFMRLEKDHLVESTVALVNGRPSRVYKLTTEGIQITAKDHPDEAIRFALGGMLPEELDPLGVKDSHSGALAKAEAQTAVGNKSMSPTDYLADLGIRIHAGNMAPEPPKAPLAHTFPVHLDMEHWEKKPSQVEAEVQAKGDCPYCGHGPGVHRNLSDGPPYCDHPGCQCQHPHGT